MDRGGAETRIVPRSRRSPQERVAETVEHDFPAVRLEFGDDLVVVPAREIVETLQGEFPLEPLDANYSGEVAKRWRYLDGGGEIGVITSVTQPFCGNCSRARLSSDGHLISCLFATAGFDLKTPMRVGISDEKLRDLIREAWTGREDRYSELRSANTEGMETRAKLEMFHVGG